MEEPSLTDPLFFRERAGHKHTYYAPNGSPTGITIQGASEKELRQIKSALDDILGTSTGSAMLELSLGKPINIIVNHRNVVHSSRTDGTIEVDPRTKREVPTENGCEVMSVGRQIAHELGHIVMGEDDGGPNAMSIVDGVENPIGDELGWSHRTRYFKGDCE